MYTKANVLKRKELEKVSSIYPMFGNPMLSKNTLKEIFEKIGSISSNFYQFKTDIVLKACEDVIRFLKESLEDVEFEMFSEEFNQFVYMEEGKILQSFVDVENLPKLIVNLILSKNISPKLTKEVIKGFYKARVLFTI
ncbi:MAG: hypothetical protein ACK4OF_03680 [Aquificaceae bacterium]